MKVIGKEDFIARCPANYIRSDPNWLDRVIAWANRHNIDTVNLDFMTPLDVFLCLPVRDANGNITYLKPMDN